jgi:hypothetical protein
MFKQVREVHCTATGQDVEAAEEAAVGPSTEAPPSSQPPTMPASRALPAPGGLYQRFRQSFQRIVGLDPQPSIEVPPHEGALCV